MLAPIGLTHYLVLSAVLFCIGMFGVLSLRNLIAMLMGLEVMFNAVLLAGVAVSKYITPLALRGAAVAPEGVPAVLTGQVFGVFIITVAAAEAALVLALILAVYRERETADATRLDTMKN
ncbi:MAG: NADH-quinone oxidoreductase subunit NuoK [Dehalococcoidia bacterium]|nr:NADH-quinone oxidoreductase subunit NuoK [Dehalococcoidia bacterium]MDW8119235.1 NADH-quinone oxidoreductase subunit NuoK [Chloroflexota bacterium]